jgi:hypothetical protein
MVNAEYYRGVFNELINFNAGSFIGREPEY